MTVRHGKGEYEIRFHDLRSAISQLSADIRIITDRNVWSAWGHAWPNVQPLILEPGEHTKSINELSRCLSWLAQSGASRQTQVVAFGGGVVGDLAGFAAATYMRGIGCVQIPTTLLAQVDSSVGGKVGIDLPEGKNLAGAFHQPVAVHICLDTLETLDERQFQNGMAEVWKYGFILDSDLLQELPPREENLERVVRRCIELKAEVVEEDEFETTGLRAVLNFGHTIGHAIEKVTGFGPILHGEAISIGMVAECSLGERIGVTPSGTSETVRNLLRNQGLPVSFPIGLSPQMLLEAMRRDKKAEAGSLAFSLLTEIGQCKLIKGVSENEVLAALRQA